MTRSTKAAVVGLLLVLILAAVAFAWYILQPQVLVDTDTLSVVRDGSTITVSGILTAAEYNRLIDSANAAGNHTMVRLLAQSAKDRADKVNDSNTAREYRLVAQRGKGANGQQYLEAFDYMTDTFNRCERNFSLTKKWDELTAPVVENF